jgi:hypothetical protein
MSQKGQEKHKHVPNTLTHKMYPNISAFITRPLQNTFRAFKNFWRGRVINADIFGYILCVNVFGTCLCFSWPFCDIAACFRARRLLFVDGRVDGPTWTRTPKERQKFLFFSRYSFFAKIIDLLYLRTDPFSLFTRNTARTRYRFAQSTGGSRSFQAQTQTLSTRSE